jgi:hypothetical protein
MPTDPMQKPSGDATAKGSAAFTLADLRALRWLAIALGAVLAALCLLIKETAELLLAIGLVASMMIIAPLAIYLLRRGKTRRPK